MPEFAGQVRHSNAEYPVLDLTDGSGQFNQSGKSPVKGIGIFSSISNRSSVTQRYRTQGYLAVVGNTPYVYTSASNADDAWETEGNWAGLSATNGIPSGGLEHNALVKLSDDDYDAGWTGDPEFSTLTLKKTNYPGLSFSSSQDGSTTDGTVLGEISSNGVSAIEQNITAYGPKIVFKQSGSAGVSSVPGSIEFYTSRPSDGGLEKAFVLNEEKTAIFVPNSSAPTPVLGGFYYNSSENHFFVGVTE